ncbi:DUF177 domain-containing protein [Stakelama sp. CBK3Z-3]|uniref:DUF177 domain-containing protein n=1 Tax=Stakelama flava TaxID=2860338 RepID=A0ABS6XKD6_9SPHN|nr:DUF177 domain-containing protein [Stakelama flava]MBW4330640.1 DUF177 domain-containing protein [Stakelama flava]
MTDAEFSRPHRLDQIGGKRGEFHITAEPGERDALKQRFGLLALDRLEARYRLDREGDIVIATGHVGAAVEQACIATGDPVPAEVAEDFTVRFVPARLPDEEEIELEQEDCDTIFYTGGAIDMGEAVAETMALALDPFPRSDSADAVLREAGVLREEEAGPFGALAGLRDKLGGQVE